MFLSKCCTCLILMLAASLDAVTALKLTSQQMFFSKETGVVHQSSNSQTYPCSDGYCSVTDCTRGCLQHHQCVVYSHRSSDGQCILGGPAFSALSTFDMEDDGWITYKSGCPVHAGYAEYDYQDSVVCLRTEGEKAHHAYAVSMCADNRASLVIVKDDNYFQFLKQLLEDRNIGHKIWIGVDKKPTGDYYWLDGTPLPTNDPMWKHEEPPVEDCIVSRPSFDRLLYDVQCDHNASVICQFFR